MTKGYSGCFRKHKHEKHGRTTGGRRADDGRTTGGRRADDVRKSGGSRAGDGCVMEEDDVQNLELICWIIHHYLNNCIAL